MKQYVLGPTIVLFLFCVHNLHATMLHLLGVDHKKLTFKYQGRDFRLFDVFGHLI
jgi:hypothetical protein